MLIPSLKKKHSDVDTIIIPIFRKLIWSLVDSEAGSFFQIRAATIPLFPHFRDHYV